MKGKLLLLFLVLLAIPLVVAEDCDTFCKNKTYVSGECRFNRIEHRSCIKGEVQFEQGECSDNSTICCCKKKPKCDTCLLGEECIALGEVRNNTYCSSNLSMIGLKSDNESCSNDYECLTNYCKDDKCKQICDGCEVDDRCLNISEIYEGKYCTAEKNMTEQKADNENCTENYECLTNLCKDNKCQILCDGCLRDGKCLNIGEKFDKGYCGEDKGLYAYKESKTECKYDYECLEEICHEGKCKKPSVFSRLIDWLKNLFS